MAQHLKYWYREHRDRDRPASQAMEPLSEVLRHQSRATQMGKLGHVIKPGWMDGEEMVSLPGGEMMHHSLTAATRAIQGVRGESLNVTLTSGHGAVSQDLTESMERSWKRHHKEVLEKNHEVFTAALASDSAKKWRSTLRKDEVDYFEPDDYAFPDLRSSLDRDDPSVKELNAAYKRNNVTNLQELVEEYNSLLSAGCGANQADPVWELEEDIRRVQHLTMKRVRNDQSHVRVNKWSLHKKLMSTALGHHGAEQGQHLTNLRGFQGAALLYTHHMNPQRLQYLLCLSKARKDLSIGKIDGALWADENSKEGTLRCLNHMYGAKKAMRNSILHRFIIMGETWQLFKTVPTIVIAASDGKSAHVFYASYEPIKLNNNDILHQAFDRHGIIHPPEKIGTVEEVRQKAAAYADYESAPAEYAQLFESAPPWSPNLSPRKRARVGTGIVPKTVDNDSSSSDTY